MNCTTNREIVSNFVQGPGYAIEIEAEFCPFANNVCRNVKTTCNTDVAEAPKVDADAVFEMFMMRLAA